jgi:hypothetical protein
MKGTLVSLREEALLAYERATLERYLECCRYEQLPLREAVRQKLIRMFGDGRRIEVEGSESETEQWAKIEEFCFLGIRAPRGEVLVTWITACPKCGMQVGSDFLMSLVDLGREVDELSRTGRLIGHDC